MRKDLKILISIAAVLLVAAGLGTLLYRNVAETRRREAAAIREATAPALAPSTFVRPHSPTLGPKDAKVTLVEFFDPECESCRVMYPIVKHLLTEYSGRVRLVMRYMPLHKNSVYACSALEAAGEQGRYWDMLDIMFREQPRWASHHDPKPEILPELARQIGLDMTAFNAGVSSPAHKAKIDMDQADGKSLGINGTPTFFVNGKMVQQLGYEPIKYMIDSALAQ